MDRQQDEQDLEFEAFLRQFQPRTPPALKVGRRVTLTKLAIAAAAVLAVAIPLQFPRDKSAGQNAPTLVDVGLSPKASDAAEPVDTATPIDTTKEVASPSADAANKITSPSSPRAATPALAASSPRQGPVAQNGPLRVGGVIKPPIRIFNVNPIYPEAAKAAGIEGLVMVRITIGEEGSVTNVLVLRSVPELDQAAIDAVLQWVYEPTLLNGVPVEVEMNATVNFTLRPKKG